MRQTLSVQRSMTFRDVSFALLFHGIQWCRSLRSPIGKQDKPAQLASVRRARAHGKPAAQFRADPDFAAWLQDAEFVQVLDRGD